MGHGHCQECGRRVRGQHPLLISKAFEVGTVHFGPRLLAFAAFQKMICGVSYDKIRLGFEQMLGFPVARSTLCRAMQRLARRAKPTRDALVEALRASPVVYADETGWKQGGRRVWLWVFTNLREKAQARVTSFFMSGLTLDAIADRLDLSVHTVRLHLKQVQTKDVRKN